MCIILFAYGAHPKYNLILAANRDEYYARPTSRAAFWNDSPNTLAGRDLERGGTWLGVTKSGRYAAVTNFRDPTALKKNAPSRGFLVGDFLRSNETPADYLTKTAATSAGYNGFNLLVGDRHGLYYQSSKFAGYKELTSGVYGISNHLLDTSWPKVEEGKNALSDIVRAGGEITPASIFEILADNSMADDANLPETGIGLEYERALSPIFVSTPVYGTRSSTMLTIDLENRITFVERTFEKGKFVEDVVFQLNSPD